MKVIITESHLKHIIDVYNQSPRIIEKLMECKFTKDLKYVLYDGKFYSTKTGNEVTLNEGWLSNILHTGADIISAGIDFIIPGSGAIIDALNAIGYLIEAQFKSGEEKASYYMMALISFGFILLPGPLQAIAPVLKNAVKTGKGMASATVKKGLGIIGGSLDFIFNKLGGLIEKALRSKFAKAIIGKWGDRIAGFVSSFRTWATKLFEKFSTKKPSKTVGTGQDLNKQNAFGTTGPIVPGQDVAGKNLKSGVGGVKRPGEDITANSAQAAASTSPAKQQTTNNKGIKPPIKQVDMDTFTNSFKLPNCYSSAACNSSTALTNLKNIIPSDKLFNPKNVQVKQKTIQKFTGKDGTPKTREVIEVELENGKKTLFYKSSGSNTETTGKQEGEWFVIPGFADNGWFVKTDESVNITKGGNKYLTQMADYLKNNGSEGLG